MKQESIQSLDRAELESASPRLSAAQWSPRTWLADARDGATTFSRAASGSPSGRATSAEAEAFVVLIVAALCLTSLNFAATTQPTWFVSVLEWIGADGVSGNLDRAFFESGNRKFNGLVFWATVQILSYTVLPLAVIVLLWRRSPADYGLALRSSLPDAAPYALLFAVAVPFVAVASTTEAFQVKYPFLDLAADQVLWPYMYIWWVFYAAQFVALEFFFRGFLVHGLARSMGVLAVPVMVVPYTMLHFGKPLLEAIAAIVGGLLLGSLALKTRTVWWGALLHISVAMVMDILAINLTP